MKNYSYVGVSLIILIFGIIFIPKIIDRVQNGDVVDADRLTSGVSEKTSENTKPLRYIEINGERKKAPSFELVNQDGDTISDEFYDGKVYLVEFFFSTCPTICPIMNSNLVEIQEEFKNQEDFGIASISIDPRHDTPAVLKQYAKDHGINHPNWNLLTGDRDTIYNLANKQFGIYAGEDGDAAGGFAHQGFFVLIDQDGYVRSREDQFGNPIIFYKGSVKRNKSVAEGEEEPQINILIEDIKQLL